MNGAAARWARAFNLLDDAISGDEAKLMMTAIGEAMISDTQQNFEDQKSPNGKSWAPNAPLTKLLKGIGKNKIGINSTLLMNSIKAKASRDRVIWGTGLRYGYWFQKGRGEVVAKNGRALQLPYASGSLANKLRGVGGRFIKQAIYLKRVGPQPARPFLGVGARGMREIKRIMGEHFKSLALSEHSEHEA